MAPPMKGAAPRQNVTSRRGTRSQAHRHVRAGTRGTTAPPTRRRVGHLRDVTAGLEAALSGVMIAKLLFRDESAGRDVTVELTLAGVVIGRGHDCAVHTDDPLVSRRNTKI